MSSLYVFHPLPLVPPSNFCVISFRPKNPCSCGKDNVEVEGGSGGRKMRREGEGKTRMSVRSFATVMIIMASFMDVLCGGVGGERGVWVGKGGRGGR